MVEAREIRTGNMLSFYSDDESGHWVKSEMDWSDIKWCDEKPEEFNKFHKAIPLTEGLLERFGFVGSDDDGLWEKETEPLFKIQCMYPNETWAHIWDGAFTGANVEYAHQLQNLFYALTGEELELKD